MITINNGNLRLGLIFFFSLFLNSLSSCKSYHRNSSHQEVSITSIEKGEGLAKQYCQSCHMLPDPSLLNSKSWENGVLPQMGPRLGIFQVGFKIYPSFKNDLSLNKNFYPPKPLLTLAEWQNIFDYYTSVSPDSLQAPERKSDLENTTLFNPVTPPLIIQNPATSFVKIDEQDTLHTLIACDAISKKIYFLNRNLRLTDSVQMPGPVVNIDFSKEDTIACNIGILNPNNGKFGQGLLLHGNSKNYLQKDSSVLFNNLQRPVQITSTDFNNDGKTDYLICEFGFLQGALSWMENVGQNKFVSHILRPFPGAIKAYITDYNHDGLNDIWVLFSQGEEGIFLFTNKGNGNFSQEEVLRFPPVNGSSYFEFDDFNHDGYPDIVYTCGDNADYSLVLKPYHGIYIFMNDGKNHFAKKYFFPLNGCYKAIARDYDGDGDLDIAAISFFADYKLHPEESFVYLKNNGNFNFKPYTIPGAKAGRWLTMDAGDINGDGKIDLVLGNFSIGPSFIKSAIDWKKFPSFLVLENTGK